MTLSDQLKTELTRLPAGAGAHTVRLQDGLRELTCELEALDSLGCALGRLALSTDALAGAAPDRLRKVSDALARRLTYLLEPIAPIEVDEERCVVQMRSSPPQRQEGKSSYYELLVRRGGEISLCRYEKAPSHTRQAVPAHITREVLLRLAGDFGAVTP